MSIATQITALQNDKTAIRNAILSKGGTCPSGNGFDDFATDIATIPGGAPIFAFIVVKFSQGATCTCVNSSTQESVTALDGSTYERTVFAIPSSGTWAVTVTNSSPAQTKSASVTFSSADKGESVNLNLMFEFVLYDIDNHIGSLSDFEKSSSGVSEDADGIAVNASKYIYSNPYDITYFDTLTFTAKMNVATSTSGVTVGVDTYAPANIASPNVWDAKQARPGTSLSKNQEFTLTVDISSVIGKKYVCVKSTFASTGTFTISKIALS